MKPYAESCEQNREPISKVLVREFECCHRILEIGSGTGQHAVYFGQGMPHLTWQPSDVRGAHPGIRMWLAEAALPNVLPPLTLDVLKDPWPADDYDGVFSANTVHIMAWPAVEAMFRGIGAVLLPGGVFCLYGPFNYNGEYTSASNAEFDAWLKARDPASGVRDFEDVNRLAEDAGLIIHHDHPMPANNRTLVWKKKG